MTLGSFDLKYPEARQGRGSRALFTSKSQKGRWAVRISGQRQQRRTVPL